MLCIGIKRRLIIACVIPIALSISTLRGEDNSTGVDAAQIQKIRSQLRNRMVMVACVSKKSALDESNKELNSDLFSSLQTGFKASLSIANRYSTAFVISNSGHLLLPYSSLGDPATHSYFVWKNESREDAPSVPVQAELIAGEPYTNLAVLQVDNEKFISNLEPIVFEEMVEPSQGESCYRVTCERSFATTATMVVEPGTVVSLDNSTFNTASLSKDRGTVMEKATIYAHGGTFQTDHVEYVDACGSAIVNGSGQIIGMSIDCLESNLIDMRGAFAMPTNRTFKRIAKSLREGKLPEFGFLGIQPAFVDTFLQRRNLRGTLVAGVIDGMPGDQAGLQIGDVITQVDSRELNARDDIFRELAAYAPGEKIQLAVRRPRGPDILFVDATVRLSKRFVSTHRPSFTRQEDHRWEGATIDYATAFPPELLFQYYARFSGFDPKAVAVMDVQLGSTAWEAGLRIGHKIVAVNGQAINTPEKFFQTVHDASEVNLSVQDVQGRKTSIRIKTKS